VRPATMQVARLLMRGGQLAYEDGPALVPLAEDRFAIAGQTGEISFAAGEHSSFERRTPGRQPLRWEWRASVPATAATLAQYAGDYTSAELGGVVYHVGVQDSTLALYKPVPAPPLIARPVFADAFQTRVYTLQFTRSGNQITGFEITHQRFRKVKFVRR
jgi:hypothetical protein